MIEKYKFTPNKKCVFYYYLFGVSEIFDPLLLLEVFEEQKLKIIKCDGKKLKTTSK